MLLITAAFASLLHAQSLRPADLVAAAVQEKSFQNSLDLFVIEKSGGGVAELDDVGADYEQFTLSATGLTTLQKSSPATLQLDLPGGVGTVKLVRTNIYAEGFKVTESDGGAFKGDLGLHYRGIVEGSEASIVAFSVYKDEISAIVATRAGNYVLGKLNTTGGKANHVIYNDQDLPAPDLGECSTAETELPYSAKELMDVDVTQKDANNCVNIFMEVDYSIFQQRGGSDQAASFITGLFNEVATLYANENLNIKMSELFVWTRQDPYNSSSSGGNLDAFRGFRRNFNGNLAHLVSFQASGGVAYVDVLCSNTVAYGFSSINNSFREVPSYSWSVNVLAHELGHNFGSSHTQACRWNGNGTALDACVATEGGCSSNVVLPQGGGTIMSYCHLTSVGVNFTKGFGNQPGNLMRNRAFNGNCLSACGDDGGGGGGGGGDDDDCTAINFNASTPVSYGGGQDNGNFDALEPNIGRLRGNSWKAVLGDYEIKANTRITFLFGTTTQGEIHGIGFDDDDRLSQNRTFQLFGTQSWGNQSFRNYTNGDVGVYKGYDIPVGQFYTGSFNRLFFVNDKDGSPQNSDSYFRDILIFEGATCVAAITAGGQMVAPETAASFAQEQLSVYPNPVADVLSVVADVTANTDAQLRVIDMTGRSVITRKVNLEAGRQTLPVGVNELPAGAYFLRLEADSGFSATAKFNVLR